MKFSNIVLSLIVLGTVSLVTAQELEGTSIDAEIAAIQAAPAQERVELMNQLKQKLANMNEADRMSAIKHLQAQMDTRRSNKVKRASVEIAQTQVHIQEMQTQANEYMSQIQNMNQKQIGNHLVHMPDPINRMSAPVNTNSMPVPMNNYRMPVSISDYKIAVVQK
jgi:chromosome segregation ATPase